MRLMAAHKILIGVACIFFVLYAASRGFDIPRGSASLPMAAVGLAMAVALAAYFRTLRGK